jgi:hypothetical protein
LVVTPEADELKRSVERAPARSVPSKKNAIHATEYQGILIILLPGYDIPITVWKVQKWTCSRRQMSRQRSTSTPQLDLTAQTLDAHPPGIVAPSAAIDSNRSNDGKSGRGGRSLAMSWFNG